MKKLNILIVDDIFMNRILLKGLVSKIGHSVIEAENGKEALNKLESEPIDIILMDIEMPVMNGIETTLYIRTECQPPLKNIPIIALTAHNPENFFDDHHTVGFNQILTKPYSIEIIAEVIDGFNL